MTMISTSDREREGGTPRIQPSPAERIGQIATEGELPFYAHLGLQNPHGFLLDTLAYQPHPLGDKTIRELLERPETARIIRDALDHGLILSVTEQLSPPTPHYFYELDGRKAQHGEAAQNSAADIPIFRNSKAAGSQRSSKSGDSLFAQSPTGSSWRID